MTGPRGGKHDNETARLRDKERKSKEQRGYYERGVAVVVGVGEGLDFRAGVSCVPEVFVDSGNRRVGVAVALAAWVATASVPCSNRRFGVAVVTGSRL